METSFSVHPTHVETHPSFHSSSIVTWYSRKIEEKPYFLIFLKTCWEAIQNFFLSLYYSLFSSRPSPFEPLENLKQARQPKSNSSGCLGIDETDVQALDQQKMNLQIPDHLISKTSNYSLDKQIEYTTNKFEKDLGAFLKSGVEVLQNRSELHGLIECGEKSLAKFNELLKVAGEEHRGNLLNPHLPLTLPLIEELKIYETTWELLETVHSKLFLEEKDLEFINTYKIPELSIPVAQKRLKSLFEEVRQKPTVDGLEKWISEKEIPSFLAKLKSDIQIVIEQNRGKLTIERAKEILSYGRKEIELFNKKITAFVHHYSLNEVILPDSKSFFADLENLILTWQGVEHLIYEQNLERKIALFTQIANQFPEIEHASYKGLISIIEDALATLSATEFGFLWFGNEKGRLQYDQIATAFQTLSRKLGCKNPDLPKVNMVTSWDALQQENANRAFFKRAATGVLTIQLIFGPQGATQHLLSYVQKITKIEEQRRILWQILNQMSPEQRQPFIDSLSFILYV